MRKGKGVGDKEWIGERIIERRKKITNWNGQEEANEEMKTVEEGSGRGEGKRNDVTGKYF